MSENQKKIWITGASSGIGKAVAEKFAKEGWKVAASARRKALLDELAKNQNIKSNFSLNSVKKIDEITLKDDVTFLVTQRQKETRAKKQLALIICHSLKIL